MVSYICFRVIKQNLLKQNLLKQHAIKQKVCVSLD